MQKLYNKRHNFSFKLAFLSPGGNLSFIQVKHRVKDKIQKSYHKTMQKYTLQTHIIKLKDKWNPLSINKPVAALLSIPFALLLKGQLMIK